MADWVDKTEDTDQDGDSIGCGMAFISWLMSTGYALNAIAPAMVSLGDAGTLAQLYAKLTGDSASNAWSKFQTAIKTLPNGVTSDDPFNAFTAAASALPATLPAQVAAGQPELRPGKGQRRLLRQKASASRNRTGCFRQRSGGPRKLLDMRWGRGG